MHFRRYGYITNYIYIVAYANIWHFAECKAVFASMMLVHLLPDTRTAATSRIVVFINVSVFQVKLYTHIKIKLFSHRNSVMLQLKQKI